MGHRMLAWVLTLTTAGVWLSSEATSAPVRQDQSAWQKTDTQHFEIHYLRALGGELDRVVRSAERAYDRISGKLNFALARKVPLVVFGPSGPLTQEEVAGYATSDQVAPQQPHRSRIVLPLRDGDAQLDALLVHELTHLVMYEIVWPGRSGDGGVPRWVREGIASHMVGDWPDGDERLVRELVATDRIPSLSQLTGSGGSTDARLDDAVGHAAFDYIESRWGPSSIRRFIDALIVPRVDKTYEAVFELTPAEFDTAFRRYAEHRFGPSVR